MMDNEKLRYLLVGAVNVLLQEIAGNFLSWLLIMQGIGLWFAVIPAIASAGILQY